MQIKSCQVKCSYVDIHSIGSWKLLCYLERVFKKTLKLKAKLPKPKKCFCFLSVVSSLSFCFVMNPKEGQLNSGLVFLLPFIDFQVNYIPNKSKTLSSFLSRISKTLRFLAGCFSSALQILRSNVILLYPARDLPGDVTAFLQYFTVVFPNSLSAAYYLASNRASTKFSPFTKFRNTTVLQSIEI